MQIFRLPGIYGPSRGTVSRARKGTAKLIEKEGQVFSRIHVDDIVGVLMASIKMPNPGRIYNVVDDVPKPNWVVTGKFNFALLSLRLNLFQSMHIKS